MKARGLACVCRVLKTGCPMVGALWMLRRSATEHSVFKHVRASVWSELNLERERWMNTGWSAAVWQQASCALAGQLNITCSCAFDGNTCNDVLAVQLLLVSCCDVPAQLSR